MFDANADPLSPIDRHLVQQAKMEAAMRADQSGIVDLLEESAYPLVTKNEQFRVKFEG